MPPRNHVPMDFGTQKRSSSEVKTWHEYWFDYGAFKFRRLNDWNGQVNAEPLQQAAQAEGDVDMHD